MSKPKAALSQVEYLQNKYDQVNERIISLETQQKKNDENLHDLYFQKGKIFADLELMKRVPVYED
ncbi:hypothetical protein M3Y14_34120 (plasmid) [Bacillus thuringiensis]|uniref:hypothetical protein n=1 Tax=Bacillus thuringiensis TaxID=1428 RepID=UPI0022243650|nr:hypothetical protein [Bacillus thuringiensis]UYX56286.1 hypothetical protein M3Y14_34120 [Bacillus thuringiensis]